MYKVVIYCTYIPKVGAMLLRLYYTITSLCLADPDREIVGCMLLHTRGMVPEYTGIGLMVKNKVRTRLGQL